jgi:hypothetical protein
VLPLLALFALVTAIFSGIAKLTVDATIQERVPERLRASAFGHSETILMIAWVLGGAIGIIPLAGRPGVAVAAALAVAAAIRAAIVTSRQHNERLQGRPAPAGAAEEPPADPWPDAPTAPPPMKPTKASTEPPAKRQPPPRRGTGKPAESPVDTEAPPAPAMAPPGYHIYRPSSAPPASSSDDQ